MTEHLLNGTDVAGGLQTDRRRPVAKVVRAPFAAEAGLHPLVDRGWMHVSAEPAGEVVRIDALLYLELMKKRRGEVVQWQYSLITVLAHNSQRRTGSVAGVGTSYLLPPQAERRAQSEHRPLRERAGAESTEHDSLGNGPRYGPRNPHRCKCKSRIAVDEPARVCP